MSGRPDLVRVAPLYADRLVFFPTSSHPPQRAAFTSLAPTVPPSFLLPLVACFLSLVFLLPPAAAAPSAAGPAVAGPPLWSVARAEVVLTPGPTSVTCRARFQVFGARVPASPMRAGVPATSQRLAIPLLVGSFTVESVNASGRAHVTFLGGPSPAEGFLPAGGEAMPERGRVARPAESQQLVCVLDRPGEEAVTVTFRVPVERTERGLRFTVPLADATQNELRLELADANSTVETEPQAVLRQAAGRPAGQLTEFVIRPVHPGPVTVTVTVKGLPGDELTYSESHSVSQWEGKPGYRDVVDLVFSGPKPARVPGIGVPGPIDVPEGAVVREVRSAGPLTWSLSPDGRQLLLDFGGEGPLRQTVSVILDLSFDPDDPSISLGSMRVPASPMRAHARRLGGSLSLDLAAEEVEARGLARTAGPSVPRYEFGAEGFSARFRLVSPKVFLRAEMLLDAHLERGNVRCLETVSFAASGGPPREFRLRLPEGVEVHPQGIPESDLWWVTDGPPLAEGLRPAGGVLVVRPAKKPDGTYRLNLQYEVPVSPSDPAGADGGDLSCVELPVLEPIADELRGQLRVFLEPGLTAQALESRELAARPAPTPTLPSPKASPGGGAAEGERSVGQESAVGVRQQASGSADQGPALAYDVTGTGVRLLLELRRPTAAVEVRTLTLVTFEGERTHLAGTVVGSIVRVGLGQLQLQIPAGFVVTEVTGSPRPPAGEHPAWEAVGDGSVLRLDLGERYIGDIRFEVQAERARGRDEKDVVLAPLAVKEATRSTAYLAAVTERDLTATAEGVTGLLAVPPGVVPSELGLLPAQALCYRLLAGAGEAPTTAGRGGGGEVRFRIAAVEPAARARSTTVLHFTQGLLSATSRVTLTVSKGGLEAVEVVLPPGSGDVAISGPSVRGSEKVAEDTWRVQFAGKVYDQAEFTVEAKSIISQSEQEVTYPGVDIVGIPGAAGSAPLPDGSPPSPRGLFGQAAARQERLSLPQTGTVVVATDPDFEVEERGTEGLSPTLGKGAPGYGDLVDGRALYGYSFERMPFTLSLRTTRLARAETVQARASAAQLTTVIADRETAVSRMLYFVENPGRKQFVVVRLEPGCVVWSTTANGIPVKPAQSPDGSLLIPIAEESHETGAVQVELVFAEPVPKLGTTAPRIALRSPGLDIPVEDLRWDVWAPKGYFLFSSRGEVVPYETPEVPGLRDLLSRALSWLPGAGTGGLRTIGGFLEEHWLLTLLFLVIGAVVGGYLILRRLFRLLPRISLITVILILGIVVLAAGMVLPALGPARSAARQAAWVSNSRSNLKQIGIAMFMYANANGDALPISSDQVVDYLEGRAPFDNPSSAGTGYVYVQGLPALSEIQNPAQVIVAFEEESHRPEGTNALFLDGHVATVPKTPEQIRQQVLEEFAGRPLGFEVARGEVPGAAGGERGFMTGFGRMEAPLQREGLQQAASKAGPADEFRGAERQRLNAAMLKGKYEREAGKAGKAADQQEAFLWATVVRVPEAEAVTEVHAGQAKGAMPMLLSLPTGGERYRLYQPFVEREPGGFTLTLLARRPFQWVRVLLFLVLTGGFVASARRWPRGSLAAGGAATLVLLLVHLTSSGGVRLLSEAALGATVIALIAAGVIYQRRQSAHENQR